MSPRIMYVVQVKVPLDQEERWNRWYDAEHVPLVLEQPGFIEMRKFRSLNEGRKEAEYTMLYELRNLAAYENFVNSEDAAVIRQHHLDAFGATVKISRTTWKETFRQKK